MKERIENFWYYHKVYVLVGLFIVVVAVMAIFLTGGAPTPDIQIGYVSDGREVSEEAVANIKTYFENEIIDANQDEEKTLDLIPLIGPRVDVEFSDNGAQIVLIDGNTLNIYKDQGVFEPLDEIISKNGITISENTQIKGKLEDQNEEHIYALPVDKVKFLLDLGFPAENYYLAVRVEYDDDEEAKTKNKNAYSVLNKMLEYKG